MPGLRFIDAAPAGADAQLQIMTAAGPMQLPAKSEERTIGFSMFENLGIGAYNPKGLVRLIVSR